MTRAELDDLIERRRRGLEHRPEDVDRALAALQELFDVASADTHDDLVYALEATLDDPVEEAEGDIEPEEEAPVNDA